MKLNHIQLNVSFITVVIYFFFFSLESIHSQENSAEFEPEWLDSTQFLYISDYAEVFRSYLPTKHLFKISINGYFNNSQRFAPVSDPYAWERFAMGYERRIGRQFSIELKTSLGPYLLLNSRDRYSNESSPDFGLGLAVRRYFNSSIKTEYCLDRTNLSGLYKVIEAHTASRSKKENSYNYFASYHSIGLGLGYQKRILNYGFVNFKLTAGYEKRRPFIDGTLNYETFRGFFLYPSLEFGFALGGQRSSKNSNCVLFNCQQEADELIKLDLFPLLHGNFWRGQMAFGVHLEREKKINESPFSYTTGIGLGLRQNDDKARFLWSVYGDIRYYYNLRPRIRKGRTANNFSASFISFEVKSLNDRWELPSWNGHNPREIIFSVRPTIYWGIQRTILNKGFIQYRLGPTFFEFNYSDNSFHRNRGRLLSSDLKIGIVF